MQIIKLQAALLILLSAVAIQAQEQSLPSGKIYTVIINNTCHRDIRVAIHYSHPEMGWVTQGWWEVNDRSELATGIVSDHNQFYMHGNDMGRQQWPPEKSRKKYNHYPVSLNENFSLESAEADETAEQVKFSLKEISLQSPGLKATFDC
jgi:hypothetical protein